MDLFLLRIIINNDNMFYIQMSFIFLILNLLGAVMHSSNKHAFVSIGELF